MSCIDIAKITGQHLLFLGTSTASWSIAQFQQAAQFAKAHGIDALVLKIADGTYRWYGGLSGYQAIKAAIQTEGVGVIPYTYSYGNKYNALDSEIDILISYMQDSGVVVADMEVERGCSSNRQSLSWNYIRCFLRYSAAFIRASGLSLAMPIIILHREHSNSRISPVWWQ